jgi:hypothetical protein
LRSVDAIQQRHGHVEHRHFRLQCHALANRLAAVADFSHDVPFRTFFQNLAQPLAHQRVIVAKQQT